MLAFWDVLWGILLSLGTALMLGANYFWIRSLAKLFKVERTTIERVVYPPAAVILPLRGADPFLEQTLTCLFQLDYPNYEVIILADDQEDPALKLAEKICLEHDNVNYKIQVFKNFSQERSLKVSALISGVEFASPHSSLIAILDADAQPQPTWLKDLMLPLIEGNFQLCCGIRWFCPEKFSMGSVVRQLWNVYAIVQMHRFVIPWGGSLALRKSTFNQAVAKGYFEGALSEDTSLGRFLLEEQQQLKMIPTLIMVNKELTDFPSACKFIRRQMIVARLHHPYWNRILSWNCLFFFFPLAAYIFLFYGWFSGWLTLTCVSLITICIVQFTMLFNVYWIVKIIKSGQQSHVSEKYLYPSPWILLPILYLTLLVTFCTTVSANFVKRVSWRGIDYRIIKHKAVFMESYKPYKSNQQSTNKQMSL